MNDDKTMETIASTFSKGCIPVDPNVEIVETLMDQAGGELLRLSFAVGRRDWPRAGELALMVSESLDALRGELDSRP